MRVLPDALRQSIQTHLIALVLMVMLPVSAIWGWHIHTEVLQDQAQHFSRADALADNVVDTLTAMLEEYESLGRQLSKEYQGNPPRPAPAFNPQQFVRMHDVVVALGVRGLDGASVYESARPALSVAQLSATQWGQRALREDRFRASGAVWDPRLSRWVGVLTHPVHDKQGQRTGFVHFSLDLGILNQRVFGALPDGALVIVVDPQSRVVLRSDGPEQWIGKTVPWASAAQA